MVNIKITGGPIDAWSHSRWDDYEQCAYMAGLKHVMKMKTPGSPAMDRGSMIHKLAEKFVSTPPGKAGSALPDELRPLAADFRALRKIGGKAEMDLAFDKDWNVTSWFNEANKPKAWCRVKADHIVLATPKTKVGRIIDYKTGKLNDKAYDTQLELYAVAELIIDSLADEVSTELWFTDAGKIIKREAGNYKRAELPMLKKTWERRVSKMLSDTRFTPTPNSQCKWCHFRKSNGGPCSEG